MFSNIAPFSDEPLRRTKKFLISQNNVSYLGVKPKLEELRGHQVVQVFWPKCFTILNVKSV